MQAVPSAVMFDLDGTLVDHVSAQQAALEAGLNRRGLGPLTPQLMDAWRELERRHMDQYLAGECSFLEQRRRRLLAYLPLVGGDPSEKVNAAWWDDYGRDYEAAWTSYPDVTDCLEALRSIEPRPRLGVLTNGDSNQQRDKLARFGLIDLLDGVFVSSEIGFAKPDPRSFLTACDALGVPPGETLFVGDSLEVDALAAIEAGLVGVWLDRSGTDRVVPCSRITTLGEVPGLLAQVTSRQMTEPALRRAARVLLVRFVDPASGRTWWATPGGGVDANETFEAAAQREIAEETGLALLDLGPCVWTREHRGDFMGRPFHVVERIFLARVSAFEPTSAGYTELERQVQTEARWWTLDELEASQEEFAPTRLALLLGRLLRWGPSVQPIDVGV